MNTAMEMGDEEAEKQMSLDRNLALLHVLKETCGKAVHKVLIQGFKKCEYVCKNFGSTIKEYMTLDRVLCQVNANKNVRSKISNIMDNKDPLIKVKVEDMLTGNANEKPCSNLLLLDLNFAINIVTNEVLSYDLDEETCEAILDIKKIRKDVHHANAHITKDLFDRYLNDLMKHVNILYNYIGYPLEDLSKRKELVCKESTSRKSATILYKLRAELQKKYVDPNYMLPRITHIQDGKESVVEDLAKFVEQQRCSVNSAPILLCGVPDASLDKIMQHLAVTLTAKKLPLVLLLVDPWQGFQVSSGEELLMQVKNCLIDLAPNTMDTYASEDVDAVLRLYWEQTVFLVDWGYEVQVPSSVRNEMQKGTWVLAHRGKPSCVLDWQVLQVNEYTQSQVEQLLIKMDISHIRRNSIDNKRNSNNPNFLEFYQDCQYKAIITSHDMIKAFCKMAGKCCRNTECEFVKVYVTEQLKSFSHNDPDKELCSLGEVAFQAAQEGRTSYSNNTLTKVPDTVKKSFLEACGNKGPKEYTFAHAIVRDFVIAKFVSLKSDHECKGWLQKARLFSRAFCFTCYLWHNDNYLKDNEQNIKDFLESMFLGVFNNKSEQKNSKSNGQQKQQRKENISLKADSGKDKNEKEKEEPMEVESKVKEKRKKCKPEPMEIEQTPKDKKGNKKDKVKKFKNWKFLLDIEEACFGDKRVVKLLADIISHFPEWVFPADLYFTSNQVKILGKILEKVSLNNTVTIDLECTKNLDCLCELWNKLKHLNNLQDKAYVRMLVGANMKTQLAECERIEQLPDAIAGSDSKVYISHYSGPMLCKDVPDFLKCACLMYLSELDVTVYDVASMKQMLSCLRLKKLEQMKVVVDLKVSEQSLCTPKSIPLPENVNLRLVIIHFDRIQQLLDSFDNKHNLSSLSIHDLVVTNISYQMDLAKFTNLKSLNFLYKTATSSSKVVENSIGLCGTLERQNWMFALVSMSLPKSLERLLLRNAYFYQDNNQYLLWQLLQKYTNLVRLVMLDCMLTLSGARKVVSRDEKLETLLTKKMRVQGFQEADVQKLVNKKPRLSKKEREELKRNKPKGREVVIISEVNLCTLCKRFPCLCPVQQGQDIKDSLDDVSGLIEDIYTYNILTFSYSSEVCSVRKNVCGDLRVECRVSMLNDDQAMSLNTATGTPLHTFFLCLILAQYITLQGTSLTPKGVAAVIEQLHYVKQRHIPNLRPGTNREITKGDEIEEEIEPFNLTIETNWFPTHNVRTCLDQLHKLVTSLSWLSVFELKCESQTKCIRFKKTFRDGKVFLDNKPFLKIKDSD